MKITHAIKYLDNAMGDADIYYIFGRYEDGTWFDENNRELLLHEGDEILDAWPLVGRKGDNTLNTSAMNDHEFFRTLIHSFRDVIKENYILHEEVNWNIVSYPDLEDALDEADQRIHKMRAQ